MECFGLLIVSSSSIFSYSFCDEMYSFLFMERYDCFVYTGFEKWGPFFSFLMSSERACQID